MGSKFVRPCPMGCFLLKINIVPSGCWEWNAALNTYGYGSFSFKRKLVLAHRFAYETLTGNAIPAGLQIDHLCRNHKCVNPDHLEVVTFRENQLRGFGFTTVEAAKTHCPKGHPYDESNTRYYDGGRFCRACERQRYHARKALKASVEQAQEDAKKK